MIAGRGEAVEAQRRRFDAPELAAIRYADPAAWISATAVLEAITERREAVAAASDRVGVIAISAEGPVEATAAMYEAAKSGSSSPIRYPASNAGSLAGLTAIAFGFRGPTLMITLPAARGVSVGVLLAEAWLARDVTSFVAVSCCSHRDGKPVARTLLLARGSGAAFERERDAAWLAAVAEQAARETR